MPVNHKENTQNGNFIGKYKGLGALVGRTSGLAIPTLSWADLTRSGCAIGQFTAVASIIVANDGTDWDTTYDYRRSDHEDRDGNMPVAPGGAAGVIYREYHVPDNGFPNPSNVRLIADVVNQRLYITATHYDVWVADPQVAKSLNTANHVAPGGGGANNAFFLLTGVNAVNALFQ